MRPPALPGGAGPAAPADGAVSHSGFDATLPDIVQVGGVWTPPELRGRDYGRAFLPPSGHARTTAFLRKVLDSGAARG